MRSGLQLFLICLILAALNLAGWYSLNRPADITDWLGGKIESFSYAPYQADQSPFENKFPTSAQMRADLKQLAPYVKSIRTYSATNGQEALPRIARKLGLQIVPGAWLNQDLEYNEIETNALIKMLQQNRRYITRAIVGNEVILRGDLEIEELIRQIRRVKRATRAMISTAEISSVWLKYPELGKEVDFIAVHILPYWEGVPVEESIDFIMAEYQKLVGRYPDKPIVISEIGWPSEGPWIQGAHPSLKNQATFIREFLKLAQRNNLNYTLMEAFDQPWKINSEGPAGASWGLFDVYRQPKYELVGDVFEYENWASYAGVSIFVGIILLVIFVRTHQNLRWGGMLTYGALISLLASSLVWTAVELTHRPYVPLAVISWAFLLVANIVLMLIMLGDGLELVERIWLQRWTRRYNPLERIPGVRTKKVSVHVPAYNEPPDMLIETLRKLAQLNYPDFEVLVIDNNTKEEDTWRPVEAECARLGSRFRFFHLAKWPGFKAGALNFALTQTHPDAEIIAVIDSDYQVDPEWLDAMTGFFENEKVGFVQSPQDYHDWRGDRFKTMCYHEYSGFFHIGMVQRNERNAIIQHGTMTIIRKNALEMAGGWGEWCITEDSELGLRLFRDGWEAIYCSQSFGKGQIPDTFNDYRVQRHRWAYGAMQILKRHWRALLIGNGELTFAQRYHFMAGWLPWFSDALHLGFVIASFFWSIGLLINSSLFGFPPTVLVLPAMIAFLFKMLMHVVLFRRVVGVSRVNVLGSALAGMSLSYTVGRAIWQGLFTSGRPFVRTPKWGRRDALMTALVVARDETLIAVLLWVLAASVVVIYSPRNLEAVVWSAMLLVQSIPCLAALVVSLISVAGKKSRQDST